MKAKLRAAALVLLQVGAVVAAIWLLRSTGNRSTQSYGMRGDR